MTVTVEEPDRIAALWGDFLGVEPREDRLELHRGYVAFEAGAEERLAEIHVEVPGRNEVIEIGGARFRLEDT